MVDHIEEVVDEKKHEWVIRLSRRKIVCRVNMIDFNFICWMEDSTVNPSPIKIALKIA